MKHYRNLKIQTLLLAILFVVTASLISGDANEIILVTMASLLLVGLIWRLFRALQRQIGDQQFNNFRQLETLTGLYSTLDMQHPLPLTRHTAASPDFLHLLANEIFRVKPTLIVEVGSGTSTLVAAYCLKKIGRGKIISLDHLEKYATITRQTVESHELDKFATVVHAPLKQFSQSENNLLWYDDSALEQVESIDLLIVDGPPKNVSALARYPAISLLRSKLHKDTVVLLDDGDRVEETQTVNLWKKEHGLVGEFQTIEKGAFVCRFEKKSEPNSR